MDTLQAWVKQYADIINAFGQTAQVAAAVFAAVAAWLSWKAIRVAQAEASISREESGLNKQAFEFSWQPLLEVRFSAEPEKKLRDQELVLPSHTRHKRFKDLQEEAQSLVIDFNTLRTHYDPLSTEIPHPNHNFLVATIKNLQSNPVGQAVNIVIGITFIYPSKPDDSSERIRKLCFSLESLAPSQEVKVWIADISTIPFLRISATEICCTTWRNETVNRGAGGQINFDSDIPKYTMSLVDQASNTDRAFIISLREGLQISVTTGSNLQPTNQELENGDQSAFSHI